MCNSREREREREERRSVERQRRGNRTTIRSLHLRTARRMSPRKSTITCDKADDDASDKEEEGEEEDDDVAAEDEDSRRMEEDGRISNPNTWNQERQGQWSKGVREERTQRQREIERERSTGW